MADTFLFTNNAKSTLASGITAVATGKAVNLNRNSITWLGGNNPAQVKGAVS